MKNNTELLFEVTNTMAGKGSRKIIFLEFFMPLAGSEFKYKVRNCIRRK